ncbi:MAG: glycosyltransferase [Pseudomonadales bacterium]
MARAYIFDYIEVFYNQTHWYNHLGAPDQRNHKPNSMTTASVLLSVYHRESADTLNTCMQSLVDQTRMPGRIILVRDGPLNSELETVIEKFANMWPELFQMVNLPENRGLTSALNEGLRRCTTDYVLRMDADDIAAPERFERQLAFVEDNPDVAVLGTAMWEFVDHPGEARLKPVKESHAEIVRQLPWRNPVNHATVCYRTEAIKQAGGYPELPLLEDYFLWAKVIKAGYRLHNLPEALYYCRFDDATLGRRAGWQNFKNECSLRLWMYRHGLVRLPTLLGAITIQFALRFSPTKLQRRLWRATRRQVDS